MRNKRVKQETRVAKVGPKGRAVRMGEFFESTQYGFTWGAATVERYASHGGYVVLGIKTRKGEIIVQVSPSGIIEAYITGQRQYRIILRKKIKRKDQHS